MHSTPGQDSARRRSPNRVDPRRILRAGIAIVALVAVGLSPEFARAALTSDGTPTSDVPTAEDCTVQPRAFDDIADLANAPFSPAVAATAGGRPAGDETVDAVVETVRLAIACANANDPLRWLALFTDRFVAERFGPDHPDDLGSLNAVLSRTPAPAAAEDLLSLVEIRDVVTLSDDRVAAVVVTENRSYRFVDRLELERVDDRWLIDSWTPTEEVATPAA